MSANVFIVTVKSSSALTAKFMNTSEFSVVQSKNAAIARNFNTRFSNAKHSKLEQSALNVRGATAFKAAIVKYGKRK